MSVEGDAVLAICGIICVIFFNVTHGFHNKNSKIIDNGIYVKAERERVWKDCNAVVPMRQRAGGRIPKDFKRSPLKTAAIGASFKTSHFGQSLRWLKNSILNIRPVFLWLRFSIRLELDQTETF
jgi:hypothetical protein